MIIFLYGEDSYRSRQKLNEIVEEYKKVHKSGLSLNFIDCEEESTTVGDLRNSMRQTSMFKEKKMTIISNIFSDADFKEKFLKGIKEFIDSEDILVIYENKGIKKTDALLKFLEKNVKSQGFSYLGGQKLKNWAEKEIKDNGATIDDSALLLLINHVGEDLWQMSNEIQKLVNFKKKKLITTADINLLIKPKIESDIFKTIDAIGEKNKKQALNLLYRHLENGDSPIYLLSMIGYQFRNLLMVKDLMEKNKPYDAVVKRSGLHPFVARKSYYQARQFSFGELKKIYRRIFEVDLNIKTGIVGPETALEMLISGV
ncbi:MAG: DNA polymerase III subunit delta [Candidatus Staskawiczbacteria bacterium]|jgi:DNA polymerase-3 subunit delta